MHFPLPAVTLTEEMLIDSEHALAQYSFLSGDGKYIGHGDSSKTNAIDYLFMELINKTTGKTEHAIVAVNYVLYSDDLASMNIQYVSGSAKLKEYENNIKQLLKIIDESIYRKYNNHEQDDLDDVSEDYECDEYVWCGKEDSDEKDEGKEDNEKDTSAHYSDDLFYQTMEQSQPKISKTTTAFEVKRFLKMLKDHYPPRSCLSKMHLLRQKSFGSHGLNDPHDHNRYIFTISELDNILNNVGELSPSTRIISMTPEIKQVISKYNGSQKRYYLSSDNDYVISSLIKNECDVLCDICDNIVFHSIWNKFLDETLLKGGDNWLISGLTLQNCFNSLIYNFIHKNPPKILYSGDFKKFHKTNNGKSLNFLDYLLYTFIDEYMRQL